MDSVNITIHLPCTPIGNVQSVTVATTAGPIQFVLSPPSGSGPFSTTYAQTADGVYCVLIEVPPDPVNFPGPVDDPPKQPSKV